ncbi:type IX secretion system membrane protein PorP/SprF [Aquirufa antheringensis]
MRKLALLIFLSFAVNAQQESLRMVYPFLPLAINPADAGAQKIFSAKGVFRKKPLFQTIGGASSSQQLMSIDMPLQKGSWGLGFLGYNTDQSYATPSGMISSNLGLAVIGSKHVYWGRGNQLSYGVNLGVNQYPILGKSGSSELLGSIGIGATYRKEAFMVGISKPTNRFDGLGDAPLYVQASYYFPVGDLHTLKVGTVLRKDQQTKVDLNAVFWFQEKLGIGLWYQQTGSEFGDPALLGSLEVPLGLNFRVGYSYDFLGKNVSTLGSTTTSEASGFHQIFLRYDLDFGLGKLGQFRP